MCVQLFTSYNEINIIWLVSCDTRAPWPLQSKRGSYSTAVLYSGFIDRFIAELCSEVGCNEDESCLMGVAYSRQEMNHGCVLNTNATA